MIFDPKRLREVAPGHIEWMLQTTHDSNRPMGNVAATEISDAVWLWLIGFSSQLAPVIQRDNKWLNRAINEDEKFGVNQERHRATLYQARALGEWMETGRNDAGLWNSARIHREAGWLEKDILRDGLDDYMAFAFQAGNDDGAVESAIAMYEAKTGGKNASIKKTLKPRDLGYVLCLNLMDRRFESSDLLMAGRKMLQAHLEDKWLGGGQYVRAAMWLKIVYSQLDESLEPIDVLLKAYENMPKVPRPDFLF